MLGAYDTMYSMRVILDLFAHEHILHGKPACGWSSAVYSCYRFCCTTHVSRQSLKRICYKLLLQFTPVLRMGIITTVYLKMSTIKTQCNAINTWLSSCLSVSLPFSILYKSGYVSVHVMCMCICSLSPITISEIDAFSQNKMVFHVKSVQRWAKSYVAPSCSIIM